MYTLEADFDGPVTTHTDLTIFHWIYVKCVLAVDTIAYYFERCEQRGTTPKDQPKKLQLLQIL